MPEETVRPTAADHRARADCRGICAGAGFKEMLRAVEDAQLEGAITTEAEAFALVRDKFGPG